MYTQCLFYIYETKGPWTTKPLNFDNEYFVNLLNRTWRKSSRTGPNGPMQYVLLRVIKT